MYRKTEPKKGSFIMRENALYVGETIEKRVDRIVNNQEPINDSAPIIFHERKEGVRPENDIRTDRFDIAVDAMHKVAQTKWDDRKQRIERLEEARKRKAEREAGKEGGSGEGGSQSGGNE